MSDPTLVAIDLDEDERQFMVQGLSEYFGSAKKAIPLLAAFVGVSSAHEFQALVWRLLEAVDNSRPLSRLDWLLALVLTEIAWASDLVGSGIEFTDHYRDEEVMPLLRMIQRQVMCPEWRELLMDNAKVATQSTGLESITEPELVAIDLTDDERTLMVQGLNEFSGSAHRAALLVAPLVGLSTKEEFRGLTRRLLDTIDDKAPLSDLDWARAVFLTEIAWASDVIGSGIDFASSVRDEKAAPLMRSIQRKVSSHDRFVLLRDNAKVVIE
ncbi:MAG: hypothetical protein WCB92_13410 [Mycobacterium sp.]